LDVLFIFFGIPCFLLFHPAFQLFSILGRQEEIGQEEKWAAIDIVTDQK